ncbi:PiggyBac transposable element-derived protein 4-like [Plakobranchus ocellatus]|uniref:PiggyBac transposable element-derived protein 4-like n=1 Tax=Plakobranchus ocellatus TaxID=259542 RepID=A0AAV4DWQ7_9GAST|nr:PiggyBac transposable element-derived protein 4-like [Plakobranchus ocellatus]
MEKTEVVYVGEEEIDLVDLFLWETTKDALGISTKGSPQYDTLFKIRPLYDHLNTRFPQVYYPEQQIAVDESMLMPFHGRVEFRQYLPSKPIKYGLYFCCESSSGYVLKMLFYTGKDTTEPERGHGEQVVRKVTTAYQGEGHTVYRDSFFSTFVLFKDLLQNQTTACGTTNKNRKGLPKDLTDKKFEA